MVSLQLSELTRLVPDEFIAMSYLRRANAILFCNIDKTQIEVHRIGNPGISHRWNLPDKSRIIGFFALETFYYFMVVLGQSHSHFLVLFVVLFNFLC